MDEARLTQEAVAERTGKDRATIANSFACSSWNRKSGLDRRRQVDGSHGRALLAVPDSQLRMRYATRVPWRSDVRHIEKLAARRARGGHAPAEVHLMRISIGAG